MLSAFDGWKTTAPSCDVPDESEDGANECAICCDGGQAPPCSPECWAIANRSKARRSAGRLLTRARLALRLARAYLAEGDGLESPRLVATMARYGELRAKARVDMATARGAS